MRGSNGKSIIQAGVACWSIVVKGRHCKTVRGICAEGGHFLREENVCAQAYDPVV